MKPTRRQFIQISSAAGVHTGGSELNLDRVDKANECHKGRRPQPIAQAVIHRACELQLTRSFIDYQNSHDAERRASVQECVQRHTIVSHCPQHSDDLC